MDNENNKAPENESQNAFDEIMADFRNLTMLYSDSPPEPEPEKPAEPVSREDELRLKEEQRRKAEMNAIREDIERRYSFQLENAKSRSEETPPPPKKTYIEVPSAEETVREEIERIDSLIDSGIDGEEKKAEEILPEIEEKPKKSKRAKKPKKEKKEKETEYITDTGDLYYFIYSFGDVIYRFLSRIFEIIFGIIKFPFVKLGKALSSATAGTKLRLRRYLKATAEEAVYFRKEIRSAKKNIRIALKKPKVLPSVLGHYFKKAWTRHKDLLRTAVNIALPAASLTLLIFTINYWNSVTFALEVIYNEKSIGYISDESVYIEAKKLVKDRLSNTSTAEINYSGTANLNARYALSLVSIQDINDARTISDKIVENSVDNLTHACGVYIDDEFVCAVKNESDAKTAFYNILEPYEEEAKKGNYTVSFAENIDYVQGLYSDDESIIWDASRLESALRGEAEKQYLYTVQGNETIDEICSKYGVSYEKVVQDNPDADLNNLKKGDMVIVRISTKYISFKKTVTTSSVREVEFETVQRRDATKFSGYRVVHQEGVNGTERVIKTVTYIDGELDDTQYSYEIIKEPVDEIVTVGTKTTVNGVYVGYATKMGFLWPAPSCHYVSSPYGWRSSGWHNGIDLCRSGGGAYGTPVIASKGGIVERVQRSNSSYGYMVLIDHEDGYMTRYAHMVAGSILVSVGQRVEAGQTIGKVGSTGNSTGPHLHFEVIWQGETQNPAKYIS